ncbi:Maf family nucleotide pyrophosphatase [Cecembia calidifontis]|jgi:septum formation protein|uniref:dTTP/UTP pyrophosphatase n=1 Tax=Cecembia calidifontis TaxID=1187080 RepID=A0A4Q7P940_9BACT|nr:Maf family nucleotide pyrophosphatase [Cecembia calidifontis]RZS96716.1 septum formation protein [Cecembia calidifontis]
MIDLKGKQLILASRSPRRQELLKGLHLDFEIRIKETEEDFPINMPANQVAPFLSEKKARAFESELKADEVVLASDTVVVLEGKILNKPADSEEAKQMLFSLSGKVHEVMTSITLLSPLKCVTQQDIAKVTFKVLTEEEINYYITHFQPFDKAGAYGIQDWIGFIGVQKLEGSFYTVMGLPVHLVYKVLNEW